MFSVVIECSFHSSYAKGDLDISYITSRIAGMSNWMIDIYRGLRQGAQYASLASLVAMDSSEV